MLLQPSRVYPCAIEKRAESYYRKSHFVPLRHPFPRSFLTTLISRAWVAFTLPTTAPYPAALGSFPPHQFRTTHIPLPPPLCHPRCLAHHHIMATSSSSRTESYHLRIVPQSFSTPPSSFLHVANPPYTRTAPISSPWRSHRTITTPHITASSSAQQ